MTNLIFYVFMFLMGIYFGSFFTLAVYRIPRKENITHEHSYCPNCKHRLGIWDLVPVFSYLFLRGKCHYCKDPIRSRYFLLEFLTGIIFVLFSASLHLEITQIQFDQIMYLLLGILYLTSLFIIAGIDQEKKQIQKSVLTFSFFVSAVHMIYSCVLAQGNIYGYVIYLLIMFALMIVDTSLLKKNLNHDYLIQTLILLITMIIFSGEYAIILTILLTILEVGFHNLLSGMGKKKSKMQKTNSKKQMPIAFFLCISNILVILFVNFIANYQI